ncbi:MAG: hydrolase [Acidobacteria bacterium]|nr:hydrolase [Acidobacteriota bacterium]
MSRRIDRYEAILLVIDMQRKLLPHIDDHESVEQNVIRLIHGTNILGVPAIATEQYPQGIGHTTDGVRQALDQSHGAEAIQKMTFSSCGSDQFLENIELAKRRQVILSGVETHVCVYQTALDLLDRDYQVWVVADAVSSRTERNRHIALDRMVAEGARLSSTEMILFELTVACGTDEFRAISKLVK